MRRSAGAASARSSAGGSPAPAPGRPRRNEQSGSDDDVGSLYSLGGASGYAHDSRCGVLTNTDVPQSGSAGRPSLEPQQERARGPPLASERRLEPGRGRRPLPRHAARADREVALLLRAEDPERAARRLTRLQPGERINIATRAVLDLLADLRRRWRVRSVEPDHRKMLVRTHEICKTEVKKDWHKDRAHEFEQTMCRGFFSPPWEPYKACGETPVELDTRRLVMDYLVPTLDLLEEKKKIVFKSFDEEMAVHKSLHLTHAEKDRLLSKMNEATGMKAIKLSIRFASDMYAALQGRRPFPLVVWELRKKQEENKPKISKMSIISLYQQEELGTEKEELIRRRITRIFLDKITAIYDILVILKNMKEKDLKRTKTIENMSWRNPKKPLPRTVIHGYQKALSLPFNCEEILPKLLDPFTGEEHTLDASEMHEHQFSISRLNKPEPYWRSSKTIPPSKAPSWKQLKKESPLLQTTQLLRNKFLKTVERSKRHTLHQLERLENDLFCRYKYTFIALSVLPLHLMHFKQVYEASRLLQTELLPKNVQRHSLPYTVDFKEYLLGDCDERFREWLMRQAPSQDDFYEIADEIPVWYRILESEAKFYYIYDKEDVYEGLQKLSKFDLPTISSIENPQDKLCLLILSLPISTIGQAAWQEASKFVLEEILEGNEGNVELWLHKRNLPILTKSL